MKHHAIQFSFLRFELFNVGQIAQREARYFFLLNAVNLHEFLTEAEQTWFEPALFGLKHDVFSVLLMLLLQKVDAQ